MLFFCFLVSIVFYAIVKIGRHADTEIMIKMLCFGLFRNNDTVIFRFNFYGVKQCQNKR